MCVCVCVCVCSMLWHSHPAAISILRPTSVGTTIPVQLSPTDKKVERRAVFILGIEVAAEAGCAGREAWNRQQSLGL